jgi:hypothetical protein
MTDEVLDSEVAPEPDTATAEPEQEKTLPVSRVEELVKKAKLKGRDSMQAELDAMKAENAALRQQQQPVAMGGMTAAPAVNVDEIKQQILAQMKQEFQQAKEAQAAQELDAQAQRIASEYKAKMKSGSEKYEDFDEVMADFNPGAFPNLVYLANQLDNTPDVMRELMQNPSKWATVTVLSERDPQAAQNMLKRISSSIKANELAKASEKEVAPPLSRLSSSTTGQDTGKLGIRDYKRMFKG